MEVMYDKILGRLREGGDGGGGGGGDTPTLMTEITYAELVALRDGDELVPGMLYRIIDYECICTGAQSGGHVYDIILLALDESHLSETAAAAHRDGDTYFANADVEAWQLRYCLDNDTSRFGWANDSQGKGVVYYMKDERGNECAYDFKNIMFQRCLMYDCTQDYMMIANGTAASEIDASYADDFSAALMGVATYAELYDLWAGNTAVGGVYYGGWEHKAEYEQLLKTFLSEAGYTGRYLFDPQTLNPDPGHDNILNRSVYPAEYIYAYTFSSDDEGGEQQDYSLDASKWVFGNVIPACSHGIQMLNNNVFFREEIYANRFASNCIHNTFIGVTYENRFEGEFQNNIIDESCYLNVFGNYIVFYTVGQGFIGNSVGNGCSKNAITDNCINNTIGNGVVGVIIDVYCIAVIIQDNVNNCILTTVGQIDVLQNVKILSGTSGTENNKLTIAFAHSTSYQQIAALDSNANLKIWVAADLVP